MTLIPGTRIGPYQILASLGAGGMGEVYRARDTRLNREVAIKVLPSLFASDPERLGRFTREAQTLASINHPNIAQIHGLEESSAVKALVMELVEGEDLSTLIARGPIPVSEALPMARQIAEALEAAHEQGIVHRDLKPANIKVRADGTVKVLDFGLAKALDAPGLSSNPGFSPTFTTVGTQVGVILGTAAYMSPEQAKGKSVDRRADIWAFGVVLHEMLTGTHPFKGESIAETLGLIVTREPDLTVLPPETSDPVRTLIARCLVKDARQRLRDMGDARLQLEDALAGRTSPSTAASGIVSPVVVTPRRPIVMLAAAGLALAMAGAAVGWWAKPSPPAPVVRLSIALPPGEQVTTVPAISRDGRQIAYAAGRTPASSQLYLRALDDTTPRPVDAGGSGTYPFFSPDGRSLAFFAGGRLRRVPVAGGGSTNLAPAAAAWGGTWGDDGRIIYVPNLNAGLWRVGENGGTPEQLTKPDGAGAGYAHTFPQRLQTGDVVFGFWGQTFYIAVQPAGGGAWRAITPERSSNLVTGPHTRSGHLLAGDSVAGIGAAPWSPTTTTPINIETRVLDDVYWLAGTERSWIDVSDDGTAVYVPGHSGRRRLVWVDRAGAVTEVPGEVDQIHDATVSPDGKRVVHSGRNAQWVVDLTTGARTRIMSDLKSWSGGWLPGDERVVVSSNKSGDWDLYTVAASGAGELTPLLQRPHTQHPLGVAPDGSVVYSENHPVTGRDLWILSPDGRTRPLAVTPFNEGGANFSADGRYVAYVSDESGRNEVYAVPAAGEGTRTTISINGGSGPVWSRDGKELFYRAGDDLVSVQVQTRDTLVLGERRKLLDLSAFESAYFHEFDVSADGQRFLLIRAEPGTRPTRLDVILNWFPELTRLAGR